MRNSFIYMLSIISGISLTVILYLFTEVNSNEKLISKAPPADTSLITFTAKPSDKLLIAVWDSELNAYRSFTSRADSVANGLGNRLIHKEDQP